MAKLSAYRVWFAKLSPLRRNKMAVLDFIASSFLNWLSKGRGKPTKGEQDSTLHLVSFQSSVPKTFEEETKRNKSKQAGNHQPLVSPSCLGIQLKSDLMTILLSNRSLTIMQVQPMKICITQQKFVSHEQVDKRPSHSG